MQPHTGSYKKHSPGVLKPMFVFKQFVLFSEPKSLIGEFEYLMHSITKSTASTVKEDKFYGDFKCSMTTW